VTEKFIGNVRQCDKDALTCKICVDNRTIECAFPNIFLQRIIDSFSTGEKIEVKGIKHPLYFSFLITSVKYSEKKTVKEVVEDIKESTKVTQEMLSRKVTI
jgi:hypothetical protein